MRSANFFVVLAVTLLAQCLPHPARAALGGPSLLIEATTGARLKTAVREATSTWRVQDSTLSTGTVVHEYIATLTGTVFAVSWSGPALPDLAQILGDSSSRYQAAAQHAVVRHRVVTVNDPDLVIRSEGHARRFTGQAWLPAQLPSGFTTADIQ